MINAQQGLNYPRTWTVALFSAALAGVAYGLIRLVGACLTPWARETHSNLATGTIEQSAPRAARWALIVRALARTVFSILLVMAIWWLLLKIFHVSNFIGKGPADVWSYVFDPDSGADNRAALLSESIITLRDASLGLFCGTAAALFAAGLFQPFRRRATSSWGRRWRSSRCRSSRSRHSLS